MTQVFDIPVLLWIQEHLRSDILTKILKVITFFGDKGWFWIALALFLLIFKKTRRMGLASCISLAVCILITNVTLKNLVARIRPYDLTNAIVPIVERPDDFSFPSGHTCSSFAVSLILLRYDKRIGVPAVIFSSLIAFSRLYLGVHYPTDVIAGFLVAFVVSFIVCLIMKPRKKRFGR
ncbi:MAG: phosphatase PAP2 family protein [Clostridiales bacterium]|nr:phosphatase PAP2 family protein [Clostridiales bacterium]MDU1042242.1 phosphatase PAP2 family protein [Clostridiales bacterium]